MTISTDVSSSGISPTSSWLPRISRPEFHYASHMPRDHLHRRNQPASYSNEPGSIENFDTLQLFATVTKIYRAHTFLGGIDLRAYKGSYLTPGYADGQFTFTKSNGNPVAASNTAAPATSAVRWRCSCWAFQPAAQENITPALPVQQLPQRLLRPGRLEGETELDRQHRHPLRA